MAKEYFECFAGQTCGALHDYQAAEFFQRDRRESLKKHRQDKGQAALLDAFLSALHQGAPPPMSPEAVFESSLLTLAAHQSLVSRQSVTMNELRQLIV